MFSAFSYGELSARAPVAGSSYTYAYVTIGEVLAWIIGKQKRTRDYPKK